MLTHFEPQNPRNGKKKERAQNTVKRGSFWPDRVGRRQGARPLSPTERRELPYGKDTARGPLAGLSAYARQPAKGPTMLAHLVAKLAWLSLELCWPSLVLCWPILRPMLSHVCPMWSQKIRKMGTAEKHCKTQDILMVGGLSWGYVGPSWGYVGLS